MAELAARVGTSPATVEVDVVETRVLRRLLADRSVRVGLALIGAVALLAVLAPLAAWLTGHGPNEQFPDTGLSPEGVPVGPNGEFWLGADGTGRDVLVRTLHGARVSLLVGIPAATLAMLVGTAVGLAAGFLGGRVDAVLSQLVDVVLSFPFVVTALSLVALNRAADGGSRVSPVVLVVLLVAGFTWTYFARLVRGLVIDLRHRAFIDAAVSIGASRRRIVVRDVLPNIAPAVAVYWAVQLPTAIVAEATLSFLGMGVQAPTASWGNMISDAQRTSLYQVQPWFMVAPVVGLVVTVVAFNALSSGIRAVLDPQDAGR